MITQEIMQQQEALAALCKKYYVHSLEVFGSAATNRFDPSKSDIDLLVTFQNTPQARSFNVFFDLKEEIQSLFRRDIDLLEMAAIRNPNLLQSIRMNPKELVYVEEGA
jgi:predicted nucleotidyltransferase